MQAIKYYVLLNGHEWPQQHITAMTFNVAICTQFLYRPVASSQTTTPQMHFYTNQTNMEIQLDTK